MNFLFLTTMMILIFSLVSTSMTRSLKTTALIYRQLENQVNSYSTFHNSLAKKNYSQSKSSTQKKTNTDKKRKELRKDKTFIPRETCSGENSKLNLFPLIEGNYPIEQKDLLRKTLQNLIHDLYKNEYFYKQQINRNKNFLSKFLNKMILGLKKTRSLAKTPFVSRKDREIFLMLCKGTYPSTNKQISLLDYITIQEVKDGRFVIFNSMSKPLLHAFFGKKITNLILEEEKKLYFKGKANTRLCKLELEKLLSPTRHCIHKSLLRYKNIKFRYSQDHIKTDKGVFITLRPPSPLF